MKNSDGNEREKKKQYRAFVKEYRCQLRELYPEDKLLVKRLFDRMDLTNVNDYDAAVIRKDLMGLAREEELRGSSLSNYLGENEDSFCMEIMENAQKSLFVCAF